MSNSEGMKYGMRLSAEALQTLRSIPKEQRRAVGYRLHLPCDDLTGDVKKLAATLPAYRLRVGNFRVLFTLEGQTINVFAVKNRKEAYE